MAAKMYYDNDADLALIRAKKVAIIGYGSQGHAHALNLKDSGVQVKVGLAANSKSKAKAEAHGLSVVTPAEAAKWADVVMILVPDTTAPAVYQEIEPHHDQGQDADVRTRLQHPVRYGEAVEGYRRHDDRAEGAGTSSARALRRRRRHAGADCGRAGCDRHTPKRLRFHMRRASA